MGEQSNIEWCHHTFNPWIGCTKVSPACDHCYAEAHDQRFEGGIHWGARAARRLTSPTNWKKSIGWNARAAKKGVRERVFCASLADVFDNHKSIESQWRADLWALIDQTPHLDWLLLTKRPQNIMKMLPEAYGRPAWGDGWSNVWLGTTVENQTEADRRIPHLLRVPAKIRFLSCEPLLGPVDLTAFKYGDDNCSFQDALRGKIWMPKDAVDWPKQPAKIFGDRESVDLCQSIDWVITGGESGADYRAADPGWYRSLRDQCAAAGVPFLFKQWSGKNQRQIRAKGRALDGVVHDGYPLMESTVTQLGSLPAVQA